MKNSTLTLSDFQIIDSLEIGIPILTKKRLKISYKVTQGNSQDQTDLIYRFEEDVFTPGHHNSENLASLIGAQVAINYGLFCRKIIFHGLYDEIDQHFIRQMMENTSREIYVKKILEENRFLIADFRNLQPIQKPRYTAAEIVFIPPLKKPKSQLEISGSIDNSKIAVLSSGGKDSLLSYGLLNEIGMEVHPVYINESGRHWYTALNAYRHFKEVTPHVSRIWTNADRVFNWMLRHLPFIREDYTTIRADEYPIRLWTVAVFLFGALPVLRKRGIGRLVIGDEYDTTRRLSFHGITHYDGLYDQSRYFDNALTRYFYRKGWNIAQFSVIRSLSELLIQKILVKRYPDLQQQQVSCHAAHIEGDRIFPCGRCEKCRRIVGMLTVLGADARNCGYTENQIKNCLKEIREKGVHQESAGAQQLNFMLSEQNLVDFPEKKKHKLKKHPEILNLRLDPERSPIDEIPREIRKGIFQIFLKYSEGAVKKQGRLWMETDLFNDNEFLSPYPYEKKKGTAKDTIRNLEDKEIKHDYLLSELTWPEAKKRFREVDIALLPVGAIEQHGPHLPLDTDAFDADFLARKVAENCSKPQPLVLPLVPYGVSYHHDDFSGTISVNNDTLSQFIYEIGMSAAKNGITKLIIINGHGGNVPALKFAAQLINRDSKIFTTVDTGETSDPDLAHLCETSNDVHAGEIETSTSLATRPHLVKMKKAKKFVPEFSIQYLNFSAKRSVEWFARTSRISPEGILGDPTKASEEKGKQMWKIMIKNLVELVESLKNMSLDEIYEKRL
jgi:creatinine amidohydrolase/Fe(II)-dependent formamide hydrolase-like protein